MTDLLGRTLGPYHIIEKIGRGGMATVYKAYQPSLARYVALKILAPLYAEQADFSERFQREAQAIANLNHPNILPVYDFGQEGPYNFIVMRYIEGAHTLKEVMARSLSLDQIVDLIGQIAAALEYAHQQGVIHRDVKPANVLMDGNWALLSDFGLAKMIANPTDLTETGASMGTPAYMSPEQGQGQAVDHRTDIYALGVILFEMVTKQIPHDAPTPYGIIAKRLSQPVPPSPRSLNPDIPPPVEQVILKALARRPEDRFTTSRILAETLKEAVNQARADMPEALRADHETLPSFKPQLATAEQIDQTDYPMAALVSPDTEQNAAPEALAEGLTTASLSLSQPRTIFQALLRPASLLFMAGLAIIILVSLNLGGVNLRLIRSALSGVETPVQSSELTPLPPATATPTPTLTPLAFAPAQENETLILIATFHHTEGIADTEAHYEIRRKIQEAITELGLTQLRVEVEPTRLTAEAQTEAKALGEKYDASIVIWGADTGVRITINYLNLKEPKLSPTEVMISETERTQLANPSAYASFVTKDLPAQLTFLSLFAIGQSYYSEGKYEEATKVLEKAVALLTPGLDLPGVAAAYFRLGWLYQSPLQDLPAAITAYDRAIQLNPDYAIAFFNRGLAHAETGNLEQAIRDYSQAIQLNPDYTVAFYNRGLAHAASGDLEQAIQDYTKATELDPASANAWNNLCWFGSLAGRAADVIAACERAVELAPDNGNIRESRGLARALTGDYQGAVADYKFYVAWAKENGLYPQRGSKREAWIAELTAGRNPFDQALLEELLKE